MGYGLSLEQQRKLDEITALAETIPKRGYNVKGTYITQTCQKGSPGSEPLGFSLKGCV
jgi:DNA-binding winged helix-turn-helix (wHTH) protein